MISGSPLSRVIPLLDCIRAFLDTPSISVLIVSLLFIITSCKSELSKEDYIAWVRSYENGLHVKKPYGDFIFDLQYLPSDYFLAQSENSEANSEIQQYILTISLVGRDDNIIDFNASDLRSQKAKEYYFSYQFQNDVVLEENGEQLQCLLYHFESLSGIKGGKTFVFGFNVPEISGDEVRLVIRSQYLSSLPIKISVSKKNIPALVL